MKAVFEKMPQAFRAEKAAGVNVVFQYTISGEGGGEWFAEIKEGACTGGGGEAREAPPARSRSPPPISST